MRLRTLQGLTNSVFTLVRVPLQSPHDTYTNRRIKYITVNKGFPTPSKVLRIHRAHLPFVFNTRF